MQYRYTGPGKYILGAFANGTGKLVRKAVVGEFVELTEKQFARFRDRFEAPVAQPTAEEVEAARLEAERIAEEARINAELEAEQARIVAEQAEQARQAAEAEAVRQSIETEAAVVKVEELVAPQQVAQQ